MSKPRRPLIAGNWKMNNGGQDGLELAKGVASECKAEGAVDVVVAPPASLLHRLQQATRFFTSSVPPDIRGMT